jgi:hypothetical protein
VARKLEGMLRDMVVAQPEIFSCDFPGETTKTTENFIHDIQFPNR